MKLFNTRDGILLEEEGQFYLLHEDWNSLLNKEALPDYLKSMSKEELPHAKSKKYLDTGLLPPIGSQEVWASGVTYFRSRDARMNESNKSGGADFYQRVYDAKRPELFMKAPHYRVVGPDQPVRIRRDSSWNVPEPELTLVINSRKEIVGFTIGNDMSSRDIEGQNPLYLPQAKSYDGATAIGPCVLVNDGTFPPDATIRLEIIRQHLVFSGQISITQIKRTFEELVEYLFLETTFPTGCLLMTGTGIVPPDDFTLASGDEIRISIDAIGNLVNYVA